MASSAVDWRESKGRLNWIAEYLQIGAASTLFGATVESSKVAERLLSQTVLLKARNYNQQPVAPLLAGPLSVVEKILLRGRLPLPSMGIEEAALAANGLSDFVESLGEKSDALGWDWRKSQTSWSDAPLLIRRCFEPCKELSDPVGSDSALLDSPVESRFLELAGTVHGSIAHWLTPQVPVSNLVIDPNTNGVDGRRVDFVWFHPRERAPIVIEIDGPEHDPSVDIVRNNVLSEAGFFIVRIPNHEVITGHGPELNGLFTRFQAAIEIDVNVASQAAKNGRFSLECAWGAKLQLSVVRAIQQNLLKSGSAHWRLKLGSPFDSSIDAVVDLLEILGAIEKLYDVGLLPGEVHITHSGRCSYSLVKKGDHWTRRDDSSEDHSGAYDVSILLEPDAGPWSAYPEEDTDIIVRPVFYPRDFAASHSFGSQTRLCVTLSLEDALPPLSELLRVIFRKREFREGQAQAVFNSLRGTDSIVLLPTGAGKSIIYQLSGLLTPGITLVIDPIVALIEDQIRGLKLYGIDRAIGISSASGSLDERRRLLQAAERGEFIFILVSPERMQSPQFRDTLRALSQMSRINLAVIDEAHCVSEWGHEFRPSYLNLARNLRRLGASDGKPPTLLALTGTASRAVLRDMVTDLELDTKARDTIIRPATFDRKELSFKVVETNQRNAKADFRGVLLSLPQFFQCSAANFYTPAGRRTHSGLVFTQFAKPRDGGVIDLRNHIKTTTGAFVTIYSGGAPLSTMNAQEWNKEKRENARRFMANDVPVLVATKAFGMGIDKPNIRYTIHYGMPGSLESFYQEAGRAGRDRAPAQCIVLFSRPDPAVEAGLDLVNSSLSDLKTAYNATDWNTRGDLGGAIFFHLNSFVGPENELKDVEYQLKRFDSLKTGQWAEYPLARDEDAKKCEEKALFRLVQVGFLADYEIDYGSKKFRAIVGTRDSGVVANNILNYVRSSDVGRLADIRSRLAPFGENTSDSSVLGMVGVLINFCYDTIERARRRSIFEAMEAAKQGSDPDRFRRRLLDYLQEGMDPEAFNALVNSESIRFDTCMVMIGKINNAVEAGELRGITIRFLESYPDQPALLMLRAVSETLSDDCDDTVVLDSLRNLFESATNKYSVTTSHLDAVLENLTRIAESRSASLLPAVLLALDDVGYLSQVEALKRPSLVKRSMAVAPEDTRDIVLVGALKTALNAARNALRQAEVN